MADENTTAQATYCVSCGQPLGGARFCGSCGTDSRARSITPTPVSDPVTQQIPVQTVGPAAEAATSYPIPPAGITAPEGWVAADSRNLASDEFPALPANSVEVADDATRKRRDRARAAIAGVVAVGLVAVAAGSWAFVHSGRSAADQALHTSTPAYTRVITSLAAATDTAAIEQAASTATSAAATIDTAARPLGGLTDKESVAANAQLTAESGVLSALAPLSQLHTHPLETWAAASPKLHDAVTAEQAAAGQLPHQGRDAKLPDTAAALTAATAAVGASLAGDVTAETDTLLAKLAAAGTTGAVKKLADGYSSQAAVVTAAAKALPAGAQHDVLTAYAGVLTAMDGLGTLSTDNTGPWTSSRGAILAGLNGVAGAQEAGALRTRIPSTLGHVDSVVAKAAAAYRDWKTKYAAAVKTRDADASALSDYTQMFQGQVTQYEELRKDLGQFIDRVQDPTLDITYGDAYDFLSNARSQRQGIRDALAYASVPDEMRGDHRAMIAVLDRGIAAVQAAYDGLHQAESCLDVCYYRDTANWQTFHTESGKISKQYAATLAAWQRSAAAAKSEIANRQLPAEPVR